MWYWRKDFNKIRDGEGVKARIVSLVPKDGSLPPMLNVEVEGKATAGAQRESEGSANALLASAASADAGMGRITGLWDLRRNESGWVPSRSTSYPQ